MEEIITQRLNELKKSMVTLKQSLQIFSQYSSNEDLRKIIRDATIKRFEYTFELCWKTMKHFAEYSGKEVKSPREAIKISLELGLIEDETQKEKWIEMLTARNMTSHIYNEKIAETLYGKVGEFVAIAEKIINKIEEMMQ